MLDAKGGGGERKRGRMRVWSNKVVKNLRWTSIVLGVSNVVVIFLAAGLLVFGYRPSCSRGEILPFLLVMAAAAVRIMAMICCAIEQQAAAIAILGSPDIPAVGDNLSRLQRRLRYKRWLWWTRFATVITILQFLLAMYLILVLARNTSLDEASKDCAMGLTSSNEWWKLHMLFIFLILMCFVAILQCFASSDVLRWRSFYEMQDNAWKAHYQEVFDHGIREALCCLGRVKYLNTMEEDEVYSVARLLGDLVTYRASGTGHLELLAGLALLQKANQSPKLDERSVDAPQDKIQEATAFHPFAEAAYTGPLLDVGRNPILFPCAWLHRQGVLTAWSRNRRPVLQGDNWWRGHATAFLKYVNLSPESLRRGRVNQGKCQAAYFIVVLHNIRSIVIAVRGTETAEDLITDGLGRETSLTMEDLDGLINSEHIDPTMRQTIIASSPHYGHSGIVEAARDLYNNIEGSDFGNSTIGVGASESCGFLSSLLGVGCECEGYAVRIVGHSLGGAIAALLGIRLYGRFSDLHVYAYGPLPCVDSVIAAACSTFITSIVHDSEFSSFLSVNSILRLRAAALTTLSQGGTTDTAIIYKLAQLFICVSKYQNRKVVKPLPATLPTGDDTVQSHTNDHKCASQSEIFLEGNVDLGEYSFLQDISSMKENGAESTVDDLLDGFTNPFADENPRDDPVSQFMKVVPSSESRSAGDPPEVFLPGFIIHLIRQNTSVNITFWKGWGLQGRAPSYRAIIANRENFKDILISPYMFLDHLPWRCQYALQQVLESHNVEVNIDDLQMV